MANNEVNKVNEVSEVKVEVKVEDTASDISGAGETALLEDLEDDEEEDEEEEEDDEEEEDEEDDEEDKEDEDLLAGVEPHDFNKVEAKKSTFPVTEEIMRLLLDTPSGDDADDESEEYHSQMHYQTHFLRPLGEGEVIVTSLPACYRHPYMMTENEFLRKQLERKATDLSNLFVEAINSGMSDREMLDIAEHGRSIKSDMYFLIREINARKIARDILWEEISRFVNDSRLIPLSSIALRRSWVLVDTSKATTSNSADKAKAMVGALGDLAQRLGIPINRL